MQFKSFNLTHFMHQTTIFSVTVPYYRISAVLSVKRLAVSVGNRKGPQYFKNAQLFFDNKGIKKQQKNM